MHLSVASRKLDTWQLQVFMFYVFRYVAKISLWLPNCYSNVKGKKKKTTLYFYHLENHIQSLL